MGDTIPTVYNSLGVKISPYVQPWCSRPNVQPDPFRNTAPNILHNLRLPYWICPLYTGQLVTVSRWQVRGGGLAVPPGTPPDRRRVAFADTSTADLDVGRQLTGLEQEMAGLVRLRHPNILAYIGLVRQDIQAF